MIPERHACAGSRNRALLSVSNDPIRKAVRQYPAIHVLLIVSLSYFSYWLLKLTGMNAIISLNVGVTPGQIRCQLLPDKKNPHLVAVSDCRTKVGLPIWLTPGKAALSESGKT